MNECVFKCPYSAECLEARASTDDEREGLFLINMLEAADSCHNGPPEHYTPEGFRDCAALAAARLSVSLSVHNGERLTPAEDFYAGFFGVRPEQL